MEIGRRLDAATVVSFRGYDLNLTGLEDPHHYDRVWERATAIHVLGEHLWQRAQTRGCPPGKMHALIPPAIDAAFFDPKLRAHTDRAGSPTRPLRILSVGRLDWRKGYEYALEAVRMLADRGIQCEYRIIGGGEFHMATTYARYQLALIDAVTLLGARTPSSVREEMLWADVMLHAAVSEGFSNAVLEAQAMMLPVVCTDAGGLPENVVQGKTGIIVPRRDAAALGDALARLAGDPALRSQMGSAGRSRVSSEFLLRNQIAAFGALYDLAFAQLPVAGNGASRLSLENDGAR
jgi:colanic acid/amylovoran biosynthesis glycosyltransferase